MSKPQKIPFTPGDVPCNGCTHCCRKDAVRLLPDDDIESYITETHPVMPSEVMLAHKDNGDCIYLEIGGCSIHDRRPILCRTMDCRILAMNVSCESAHRLAESNLLPFKVWQTGRDMLRKAREG